MQPACGEDSNRNLSHQLGNNITTVHLGVLNREMALVQVIVVCVTQISLIDSHQAAIALVGTVISLLSLAGSNAVFY